MIHTALLLFTCWFEADMIFEGWDVDNAWEVKCSGALDLEDALYKKNLLQVSRSKYLRTEIRPLISSSPFVVGSGEGLWAGRGSRAAGLVTVSFIPFRFKVQKGRGPRALSELCVCTISCLSWGVHCLRWWLRPL